MRNELLTVLLLPPDKVWQKGKFCIEYFGDQYRLTAIDKGLQALQPSNKYHAESKGTYTDFEVK